MVLDVFSSNTTSFFPSQSATTSSSLKVLRSNGRLKGGKEVRTPSRTETRARNKQPSDSTASIFEGLAAPRLPEHYSVAGMEKWQGRVVAVDEDIFTVEIEPLGGGHGLLADFGLDVLSEDDRIAPGDLIYITSRKVARPGGGVSRTTAVRLRRIGRWSEADVTEIKDQARRDYQEYLELFGDDEF